MPRRIVVAESTSPGHWQALRASVSQLHRESRSPAAVVVTMAVWSSRHSSNTAPSSVQPRIERVIVASLQAARASVPPWKAVWSQTSPAARQPERSQSVNTAQPSCARERSQPASVTSWSTACRRSMPVRSRPVKSAPRTIQAASDPPRTAMRLATEGFTIRRCTPSSGPPAVGSETSVMDALPQAQAAHGRPRPGWPGRGSPRENRCR